MARRRPDHTSDMTMRSDPRRLSARRRRRRVVRGFVRTVFWALVLAGVFVLGLGYGRTLSDEGGDGTGDVTITQDRGALEATLPTRTETVTKTVTRGSASKSASKRSNPER